MLPSPLAAPTDPAQFDRTLVAALQGCARRSLPSLRKVYELTGPRVLSELLQLLGDRQQAEQTLTECHVRIWQQAGFYSPERCRPLTWVLAVARNLAIDSLQDDAELAPEDVDASIVFLDAALAEDAAPALHMLRLSRASGRQPAELARALERPVSEVRRAIRSALVQLSSDVPALQGEKLRRVAGVYAAGALGRLARRRFESIMGRNANARHAWLQWEERLAAIAPEIPPVRPPDAAWQNIEQRLTSPARAAAPRWWLWATLALGATVAWFWMQISR